MKNKHPWLGQNLCAMLNTNSLNIIKLQDGGLDEWEIRVMGSEGNVESWILTLAKDSRSKESKQSPVLRPDNQHCNLRHTQAKPNSLLSGVFIGGIVCGIAVTLIVLMYLPDHL
jgi:hypothetical protein